MAQHAMLRRTGYNKTAEAVQVRLNSELGESGSGEGAKNGKN